MRQNSKTEMCDERFRKLSITQNGNAKGKYNVDWIVTFTSCIGIFLMIENFNIRYFRIVLFAY